MTPVRAVHVAELRAALDAARAAAGLTSPTYARPTLVARQTVVAAAQVAEIRAAIRAIW